MVRVSGSEDPNAIGRRSFLQRGAMVGALVALPSTALAACGSGGEAVGGASTGGSGGAAAPAEAVGGFSHNFREMDPHVGVDVTTYTVGWHVHEGLMDLNPVTREVELGLAAADPEEVRENVWHVRLRDGATFHDGTPVRASDVVFSFERIRNPETASFFISYLDFIGSARAVDDTTVEFVLRQPFALFRNRLIFIRVVPQAIVSRDARAMSTRPVGTGPYAFVELAANDHITLRRNGSYNGPKKGSYATIRLRAMEDISARLAALRASEIGVMEDPADRDLPSLGKQSGIRTASEKGFNQTILMFNHSRRPFDDTRVRQAIMYGIDRDALVRTVYAGNGTVAESMIPADYPAFARPSTIYTYDPERARALLAQAGHGDGLDFELMVNSLSYIGEQGPFIKEQLAKAGINANLRMGDSSALFERVSAGDYSAFITISDVSVFGEDPDLWLRYFHTGAFARQFLYWQGAQQREVQGLLDGALYETDTTKQQAAWTRVQELLAAEAVCPTLIHRSQPTAWRDSLGGFQPINTTGLYFLEAA
ncbi:ABC transporter substrate-binding protein [Conexibacter sp. JD483]|uniref:ABC transporter substrate-binding protein n=1 Tax=unclassified Conexibacter TaxID=2627773 RepID=UPI0027219745|nr:MULTISPECIES: ABC transporter substrate-binding protein [unclassified Conexibacter]MDO8187099.1 ABC transporter substrate-binding protein [Conexibacter sp. CPCC 205706]MDO8200957.1 ABC transporter substrate-binding protein [Conexibacter sp. CPCC 205762]MDR9371890.1 ABC transporter substrate-binding protein [Conexibacter sp. JD483]